MIFNLSVTIIYLNYFLHKIFSLFLFESFLLLSDLCSIDKIRFKFIVGKFECIFRKFVGFLSKGICDGV